MKVHYKKLEVSFDKNDKNYIEPILPLMTKPCSNCGSVMEIRPIGSPFLKTKEGIYLTHRTESGKMFIKNIMPADILYGCKDCSNAEVVRMENEEFIEG